MKGRVACEMGQNELMITELVLRNILTDLQPAEIAALLSSLVFQAKTEVEPKMTETLKKVCQSFVKLKLTYVGISICFRYSHSRQRHCSRRSKTISGTWRKCTT